ncbi:MAG: BrnT family toxin [Spirochaetaceae bacterium]|nr:MAG: BrnT family toxin [Spirochaetaceae bacterium]
MHLFEFDDTKSHANLEKHGIGFEAAQELWNDPDLLEIQANSEEELYEG